MIKTRQALFLLTILLLLVGVIAIAAAQPTAVGPTPRGNTPNNTQTSREGVIEAPAVNDAPCINELAAGIYPCENVDLLAFVPLSQMGGGQGANIWGWTDAQTGKEYALMTKSNGVAFVDISDPIHPVYVGNLPSHSGTSSWRDVRVHRNHAYIVADALPHGVQVFDLTQLRDVTNPPVTFSETSHYNVVGNVHTIAMNEETGFAYAVGAGGSQGCSGGLHMISLKQPANPSFAGCYSADGYTHETQCVVYRGPDVAHQEQEICFNANEDTLTLVDVTNKTTPRQLARKSYPGYGYTHQGWLTADQAYFLVDDELDENFYGHNTRTYIWDVSDLDNPQFLGYYEANNTSIDHNLYIHNGVVYEANYTSGLRLFETTDLANLNLTPLGFFDTFPANDNPTFNGAWGNYPFFASGVVIISDINRGLFIVRPTSLPNQPAFTTSVTTQNEGVLGEMVLHTLTISNTGNVTDTYAIALAGNQWATTASATAVGPIPPSSSGTVDIHVTVGGGLADSVNVTVTSDLNNTLQEELAIVTQSAGHFALLPAIQRP